VREHVEKFVQQLEEKEDASLQEYQQSLEEWLKRCQREFNKKMAEKVDKFKQESETKVTIVLEMCEQVAEQLRKYESLLKFDDQRPQLEQEWPEQGQPTQKQREAPAELRYEAEKLADNDQAEAQEEPTLDAAEMAADAQEVPTLDRTQSKENEVAADTHNVRSRLSTLPYGDQEEHETTAKYLPSSFRAPTVAAGTSTVLPLAGRVAFPWERRRVLPLCSRRARRSKTLQKVARKLPRNCHRWPTCSSPSQASGTAKRAKRATSQRTQ